MKYELNPSFLEKLILKTCFIDKTYLFLITTLFDKKFFIDYTIREIFGYIQEHVKLYSDLPTKEVILNSLDSELNDKCENTFKEIESIDIDIAKNYQFILESSNQYLKTRAIQEAILQSVDILDKNDDPFLVRKLIEDALMRDLKIDLGLNYFDQLNDRLKRILTNVSNRIPTYFPKFDEFINGGFPPYTLSVFLGAIHQGKSGLMSNFAARQVLHGHNVALISLEMSEDMFAQRFDAIFSTLNINRIYFHDETKSKFLMKIKDVKNTEGRGNLFIKQFPPGTASINDYRIYLKELQIRDLTPDVIYVDYINLMRPAGKSKGELYSDVKRIAEELRALSYEQNRPVISVSQLNREGMSIDFNDVNLIHSSESIGLPATCDFLGIIGTNEDKMIYESELYYKVAKNRLGGMIGAQDFFYLDSKSLKMYDSTEEHVWIHDCKLSGDERKLKEK